MWDEECPLLKEGTHLCRKKDYGDEECPLQRRGDTPLQEEGLWGRGMSPSDKENEPCLK